MTKKDTSEVEGGPIAPPKGKANVAPAAPKKGQVVVAADKAICCAIPHGIKGPGDVVEADMFVGGDSTISELLGKGYLEKA